VADVLTTLTELVWDHSNDGDTILIRAEPKIVHYLSGRPSPVVAPVFAFPAVFAASPVDQLVAEIRAARTTVVIYDPESIVPIEAYRLENLAPALHRLIIDEYVLVDQIGDLQLRRRKVALGADP
jgi:hypothetical protein